MGQFFFVVFDFGAFPNGDVGNGDFGEDQEVIDEGVRPCV